MNSRERVTNTLNQKEVDRIPRTLWSLPGIHMSRRKELEEVLEKFPGDFGVPVYRYGTAKRQKGNLYTGNEYTDSWGSVWRVGEPGVCGEVKVCPLADWDALDKYELPWELLKEADLSQVDKSCEKQDKFIVVGTETRPFERMQFLRGTENVMMDLACGEAEVYRLRDMLHEFFCTEMDMWSKTNIDGIALSDDWGTQNALLISPSIWREFFKPLYSEYCDIMHSKGKYVFFHSDGNIEEIYPDLVEIGVDAVNSQLFCMNIERLGEKYAGKITFWGEIDRQNILPFGTTDDVRNAVRRVAGAMLRGKRTGVIAQCEWGIKDPKENIEAVFDEWNKF